MKSAVSTAGSSARSIPAPVVLEETLAYWEAANGQRLLVKRCTDCKRVHFYPRDICPHCGGVDTVWEAASGSGILYSYCVMGHGPDAHIMALVTLDEGVTMMSNIVGCEAKALRIGMPLRVVFVSGAGKPNRDGSPAQVQLVPMFTPMA